MRTHLAAGILILGWLGSSLAADPDLRSADEQTLRSADLGTENLALLDFFRRNTLTDGDQARIAALICRLGDEAFDVREKASADLVAEGPRAIVLLRPAVKDRDPEIARRAQACLLALERGGKNGQGPGRHALLAAAARLVADRKPAGAVEVLLRYLPFADDDSVIEEIGSALAAMALRDGKPEPALIQALTAAEPICRGLAGVALVRAGQGKAMRKLLLDQDPAVRLRVGLALVYTGDKAGVPALIDLLGTLAPDQAWAAEDLLQRIAGEKAPGVSLGADDAGRRRCRDAWADWWGKNGTGIDLAVLDAPRRLLGYTLSVVIDAGTVTEIGLDGKLRWQVGGLGSPIEARVLPGDRLLVADYAGRVIECDLRGKHVWEQKVSQPVHCERLANGNTFVATVSQLLEFDRAGKQRLLYTNDRMGTSILSARKLRNGQIILVGSDGACFKLDAAGKELSRLELGRISNNCLDVLPNGNLLIARFFDAKVTEYDWAGKLVWEVSFPSVMSAQRLPNGNTLVACHSPARVAELDRTGRVVWEHTEKPGHRPWFASRR